MNLNDNTVLAVIWMVFGAYLAVNGVRLILFKGKHADRIKETMKGEGYEGCSRAIGACQIILGIAFIVFEAVLLFVRSIVLAGAFVVIAAGSLVLQAVFSKKYTGSYFAAL